MGTACNSDFVHQGRELLLTRGDMFSRWNELSANAHLCKNTEKSQLDGGAVAQEAKQVIQESQAQLFDP